MTKYTYFPKRVKIIEVIDDWMSGTGNKIRHFCDTDPGSSGSPILNLDTFKVIGIHSGYVKEKYNIGTIIKYPKGEIHNNLEELNENNTKIYINNIEHKYCKHFKPEKIGVYQIKIEISIPITNCSYMFSCCNNIIDFDFSSFKTRSITNMSYMFSSCQGIQCLDLSSFDTKNVTNMSNMFSFCINLREINLSSFYTSNVTNMSKMFTWCINLMNINVGNFDVSKVIEMNDMFNTCERLISIDLSSFIAKSATNVSGMLRCCEALQSVKFFEFEGENITNMKEMFFKCSSLIYLDLDK